MIRFTYNDTFGYWTFGLYTPRREPILQGIKIVPEFPLNLFYGTYDLPNGAFGAYTLLKRIGRDSFSNGLATFAFIHAGR